MVIAALGLVFARKAVHAALGMAVVMVSLGAIYLAQDADFLGVIQVFVYTGAVMMLFLFVLMLVGVDSSDSMIETITGQRWVGVLLALGLGALLVVGNTVRLEIQSRREEIGVLQLLGASDGFIRRPFLYLGAWYGLGAGVLALGLIAAAGGALREPLAALSGSYGSQFSLKGLDVLHSSMVLVATVLLGWLGAWAVTGHFLRQTRPTET